MADVFGQFPFAEQALCLAHFLLVGKKVCKDGLHLRQGHAAGGVGLYGLVQLAGAELHVVEIRNGLSQLLGDIGQHGLELPEGLAGVVGVLRVHRVVGVGIGDEL